MAQQPPKKLSVMKAEVEVKKDNTTIKKPLPMVEKVEYSYMGKDEKLKTKPTSKDSSDYREGFREGYKKPKEPQKSILPDIIDMKSFNEKENLNKKGLIWKGLNSRYNEGFSEGKDRRISLKTMNKNK